MYDIARRDVASVVKEQLEKFKPETLQYMFTARPLAL